METSIAKRKNLQVVQQAFTDFAEGNIAAILDVCADDVVWSGYKIPGVNISGSFYGKEGVQEFFTRLDDQVYFSYFVAHEFVSEGDQVMAMGHETGTVKKTGRSFDYDWCIRLILKEGKLQECFVFGDSYSIAKAFSDDDMNKSL